MQRPGALWLHRYDKASLSSIAASCVCDKYIAYLRQVCRMPAILSRVFCFFSWTHGQKLDRIA